MTTEIVEMPCVDSPRSMEIIIRIDLADVIQADFNPLDMALANDVFYGKPSETPLADKLLWLETLMRRVEEAAARRRKASA